MRARERRFIGNGNVWVDPGARKQRGWQIKCSMCGGLSKVISSHGTSVPPEFIIQRLERQGWFIDARNEINDLCPSCYSSPRSIHSARPAAPSAPQPTPRPKPPPVPPQPRVLEAFPPPDPLRDAINELIKRIHQRRGELTWTPLLFRWGPDRISEILRELLVTFYGENRSDGLIALATFILEQMDEPTNWDLKNVRALVTRIEKVGEALVPIAEQAQAEATLIARSLPTPSRHTEPAKPTGPSPADFNRRMIEKIRSQIGGSK
jgi:hypothetical protein